MAVRLPSSGNVPTVTPASDPGLQVPRIPSVIETAATELAPVFNKIAKQQQSRRDAVEISRILNERNQENDTELRRLNTEDDLSKDDVLAGYGSFMAERTREALENFAGSEDARTRLEIRLSDINAAFTGRASGISVKLGRDQVERAFNNSLVPLGESAAQNPSIENLDKLLSTNVPMVMEDLLGAYDPTEEMARTRIAQEHVVLSAINPLLALGRVEEAESLLLDGGYNNFLTPEVQRKLNSQIVTIRRRKENELRAAQSPVGKIRADEAAGIISSEDAKAAIEKETQLAREKLNIPGTIVRATDLNAELPDTYSNTFLIKQPNGNLQVLEGEGGIGGKTTFIRQEQDDGTVAIFAQKDNEPPEYIDVLRDENGEPLKTGVSERSERVHDRAEVRSKQRDRSLDISESRLEETINQNARSSEGALRDDFEKRAQPFREQIEAIGKLEVALSGNISGLDNKVITNLVSRAIAPTNVRAQAELDSFKGFGDLGERVSGAISTFFTGVRTEAQLNQIRELIKDMREKHIEPAMNELQEAYRAVATRSNLNPDNVVIQSQIKTVKSVEEALKLPKGTHFIDPDGIERIR